MPASPSHRQQITNAFITELEAFKRGGYKFNNGSDKYLFEGTQREAFNAYLDGLKGNKLKGYFEIPTGVGKTAIFIAIISCYLRAVDNLCKLKVIKKEDAPRVLIHEPTDDLIDQTALAFADFMPEITRIMEGKDDEGRRLDYENSQVHVKAKGAKSDARIVITTYQGQAADERRGTFEWRVSRLRSAINDKRKVNDENRAELLRVIAKQFPDDETLRAALDRRPDDAGPEILFTRKQLLQRFIRENCAWPDPLQVFLDAIQPHLDDANPIKSYDAQLKEKDKEKTYKPEDFHLIIHDEAHYVTGKKFGAAVDKFPGAIQLGVTATPEYSEDNAVVNKLENLYYYLPLTTIKEGDKVIKEGAIERGDCCPVCPVLIKTRPTENDKHRLAFAKRLIEQRRGLPLTDAQLQQLYNQAARNQAVIKAYLRGTHPITGERYLGKTGMIFATGIQHCKDFITHAEAVLNQPAYREVKNWLHDKGLCLIAPVHSDISDEGVEITIGGEKKLCTKDKIKELHRKGKVLLLISDKELALGTDYPQDEFGAELGDRFTKPGAAQRFGRITRVDRGNERLELKANPDKWAAWFNVMDETTHEQYKGTSHYPIHGIEILNGVVHRPKQKRLAPTRFLPQVGVDEKLGFDFVHEEEALREVARKFEKNRKKPLRDKTKEWWNITDIESKPGGQSAQTQHAISYLIRIFEAGGGQLQKDGSMAIEYKGNIFHVQKMRSKNRQPICFLGEDFIKAGLVQEAKLPPKTSEWWANAADIMTKPGGSSNKTQEAITQLTNAFAAGEGIPDSDGSVVLNHENHNIRMQERDANGNRTICFFRDHIIGAGLVQEIGLPPKTSKWASDGDILKLPGGKTNRTKQAIPELVKAFEAGEGRKLADGSVILKYEGHDIHAQKRQGYRSQPICFLGDDLIKAGLITSLNRNHLKSKPPTKQDRTPGSDDLKRKGRSREADD